MVVMAHEDITQSVINAHIKKTLQEQEHIVYKDLSQLYPTYNIDVQKEKEDLKHIEKIVFQFPMYWYSAPSLLKLWVDKVFEYGFAYEIDEQGQFHALALKDKKFQMIVTMGAKEESFVGEDRLSVQQCLNSFSYTAKMLQMKEEEPLFLYGAAYGKVTPEKIEQFIQDIQKSV